MTAYRPPIQTTKNPRRQYQGMVSRAHGQRFEDEINDACTYYARKGIASIHKTPEPMRPIKALDNGKFIAHYEKKAQPDYKGTLKGGQAIMFEAKFTSAEKMEKSRVSQEQSDSLDEFAALGACCFVLVAFEGRGYYRIPWHIWRSMKNVFGRMYVKSEELDDYKIPFSGGILQILNNLRPAERSQGI